MTTLNFRLIIEQRPETLEIYQVLSKISDAFFPIGDPLEIPINEVPQLLEPFSQFTDGHEKTNRELASRMIFYAHYQAFRRNLMNGTGTVSTLQCIG